MGAQASAATVLVVDDNWVACEIVRAALSSRGHKVLVAPTGHAGMEMLSNPPVDLVLLDLMLPDVDGGVLIDKMRQLPGGESIPILAFSAFIMRLEELQRSNAAFNGYIAKPVEPAHLIEIVEKHLVSRGCDEVPQLHVI
jgi:CheY-like chemotaxis protein